MDFGDLKRIVNREVVDRLDHSFVIRNLQQNQELIAMLGSKFKNIVIVDYQPTCENMLADFAERIANALPKGISLHSLRLNETATSFAEWYAEDNK